MLPDRRSCSPVSSSSTATSLIYQRFAQGSELSDSDFAGLRCHQAQRKLGGTDEVTIMKPSFLIAVLFAACAAQTQTLRVVPVHLEGAGQTIKSVQFFCTPDYNRDECRQHALELQRVLMTYPLERLGMWSFALVPSYKWKDLVRTLGGSTASPAFSVFDLRTTVMESSLFSATATRSAEFLHVFGVTGEALLKLAVSHELGHSVCHDQDERKADDYGRALREGKMPDCGRTRKTDHGTAKNTE